jgi:hypothetical protein
VGGQLAAHRSQLRQTLFHPAFFIQRRLKHAGAVQV